MTLHSRHICDLDADTNRAHVAPGWTRLRRLLDKFEECKTVRRTDDSQQIFKSTYALRKEKNRHLCSTKYRKIIHPFSLLASIELYTVFFVWMAAMTIFPVETTFLYRKVMYDEYNFWDPVTTFGQFLRLIMLFHLVFRLFLGYVDARTNVVVLEQGLIVKQYLKSFFVFDLGPVLALFVSPLIQNASPLTKLLVYQLNLLCLARFFCALDILHIILQKIQIPDYLCMCFRICIQILFFLHWYNCLLRMSNVMNRYLKAHADLSWYANFRIEVGFPAVGGLKTSKALEDYVLSIQNATKMSINAHTRMFHVYLTYVTISSSHFFGASVGPYKSRDPLEQSLLSFIMLQGMIFNIFVLGSVLQMIWTYNTSDLAFQQFMYQAQLHMSARRCPKELKNRVFQYYNYTLNGKYFKEALIVDQLTEHLRTEVLLHTCQNITTCPVLQDFPRNVIGFMMALVKPVIYLPKDTILTSGDSDGSLFFICKGTCVYYLMDGTEILHRTDGDTFADDQHYTNIEIKDQFVVKAAEICEVYILDPEGVQKLFKLCPEMREAFRKVADMRANESNARTTQREIRSGMTDFTGFLSLLKKGKMLEPRMHRENRFLDN